MCKGLGRADNLGKACTWLSLKGNAKELRVYPEGSIEALQCFKQRCGVIRFTI